MIMVTQAKRLWKPGELMTIIAPNERLVPATAKPRTRAVEKIDYGDSKNILVIPRIQPGS